MLYAKYNQRRYESTIGQKLSLKEAMEYAESEWKTLTPSEKYMWKLGGPEYAQVIYLKSY